MIAVPQPPFICWTLRAVEVVLANAGASQIPRSAQYLYRLVRLPSQKLTNLVHHSNSDLEIVIPAYAWRRKPTLEGWATVDNTTDEDWKDVKLSVVSGRPISFLSLLDTPRYGQRQVAELPEDRAAGTVVYGGSISGSGTGGGSATGEDLYRKEKTHLNADAASASVMGGIAGGVSSGQDYGAKTLDLQRP